MLHPKTKRHIKLLAERYEHNISYDRSTIYLLNEINSITLAPTFAKTVKVTYNSEHNLEETFEVSKADLYHPLLQLLERKDLRIVDIRAGSLVQFEHLLEEESKDRASTIDHIKELYNLNAELQYIGGNRIEAEYFKGIIIMKDNLPNFYSSNVIDAKELWKQSL